MTATITRLDAYKAKTREPYTFAYGPWHARVLHALDAIPGMTDHDLTFLLERHMVQARRCELRDAGLVKQAGRERGSMTWELTDAGRAYLRKAVAA